MCLSVCLYVCMSVCTEGSNLKQHCYSGEKAEEKQFKNLSLAPWQHEASVVRDLKDVSDRWPFFCLSVCLSVCHRGHYKALSRCQLVTLWVVVCVLAKISFRAHEICTLDKVTGNLAANSVLITFRSMRETRQFHFFHLFETF